MGIAIKTRRAAAGKLRGVGLTYPQYGVLMALSGGGKLSQREVAERIETDTTTVRVICDSLEAKGLIARRPDATDRRVNRLEVTEAGRAAFERGSAVLESGYQPLLGAFGAEGASRIEPVLAAVYAAVIEIGEKEQS